MGAGFFTLFATVTGYELGIGLGWAFAGVVLLALSLLVVLTPGDEKNNSLRPAIQAMMLGVVIVGFGTGYQLQSVVDGVAAAGVAMAATLLIIRQVSKGRKGRALVSKNTQEAAKNGKAEQPETSLPSVNPVIAMRSEDDLKRGVNQESSVGDGDQRRFGLSMFEIEILTLLAVMVLFYIATQK